MTLKKIRFPLLFLLSIIAFSGFVSDDDPFKKISSSLAKWITDYPIEKVYLHLDKPYYAVGDTIWFKGYITVGNKHELSSLSGGLYAELIDEKDLIVQMLKLPIVSGMVKGEFILSDKLKEGNYRIRAYTQWMRNAGTEYFFDKTISIGNAITNTVYTKVVYSYKTVNDKQQVTAILNYSDSDGKPYAGKEVIYEILGNKVKGKGTTDDQGNLSINFFNDQSPYSGSRNILTTIEIEKKRISRSFPIKSTFEKTDVQFFPESGQLVNGISSKVAFKAVGADGLGLAVKGILIDNENTEIDSFVTQHLGMGYFKLMPEKGKSYKAKIIYPDGSESTVNLPTATDNGYVLAVYNQPDVDTMLVRVYASKSMYENGDKQLSLVAHSGGEVLYASQFPIKKAITSLWIPREDFISGIVQFTLFTAADEPLNERIIFMQKPDQINVKVNTEKTVYSPFQKVEVNIEANGPKGNPVKGSFSVAVIDESKMQVDEIEESTILSNILLTSDIKGYIEKPNYYFTKVNEQTHSDLDVLMLTQGYRRFVWKELMTGTNPKLQFKAEKLTTDITGTLRTLWKKPAVQGKVTLFSAASNVMLNAETDAEGKFQFNNLLLKDSMSFTIQGRNSSNGKNVALSLDNSENQIVTKNKNSGDINLDINSTMATYLANSKKQYAAGMLNRTIELGGITITAKKSAVLSHNLNGPENADQVVKSEDFQTCATLRMCLEGKLLGVTFNAGIPYSSRQASINPGGPNKSMLVVLDGRNLEESEYESVFEQNQFSPSDIESIELLRTPHYLNLYGNAGANGVILINTRGGWKHQTRYDPSVLLYKPKGFNMAKEFYSPKYNPGTNSNKTDLRTTIYWNPSISTGVDGKAKFDFFNTGNKGTYRLVIEGINAEGELGRQVYRYKVE